MSRRRKKLRNPSPEAAAQLQKEREEREARLKADRETQHKTQAAEKNAKQEAAAQARQAEEEAARANAEWEALPASEKRARLDAAWLESLSPEERNYWCESGKRLYGRLMTVAPVPEGAMTPDEVATSLETCTRFLTLVTETATAMLECLDPNALRKIIAADVPLSDHARKMLLATGLDLIEEVEPPTAESAKDASPQKRPRGSRHPLMAFFNLAVQASRLVKDITRSLWPHVHNLRTLDEKEAIRQAKQSDKLNALEGFEMLNRMSVT